MNRFYKFLFIIPLIIIGCKTNDIDDKKVNQSINSLDMNIYSKQGEKLISIKSPYSIYEKDKNALYLKQTSIELFKKNKINYIITSSNSKLSNDNKLIELKDNVLVKAISPKKDDKLYSDSFTWNIEKSEFLLVGNVKFKNNSISLNSNKAILNKNNNIIEFFNPVKYKYYEGTNASEYEVNSQNAYYNIETKSVIFSSKEDRVRSKIYF
tara:strand:- start:834 stop:1463 length:630 start_codon:yes stop_codon:yes gene_type:complete